MKFPRFTARLYEQLVKDALRQSFVKLDPKVQWANPVMFLVWLGALFTFCVGVASLLGLSSEPAGLAFAVSGWLWFTLLFANFAEALAEGRAHSQAASLRNLRKSTPARIVKSAVNELQYAYTTDTAVLSDYIGYAVSAYDTDYIPEFEYAAQAAVDEGAGTIYVCAGDYGWHIIYVTATFDTAGGAVYGGDVNWTAEYVLKEGTFQNLYYNWIKDSTLSDVTSARRSVINQQFGGDDTVTTYEDTYKDLLGL